MINLIHGDCLEVMNGLESESVDAIVTDPPYGILKHKIETGIDITAFFTECQRVLKPNSFIVFFGRHPMLTEWNRVAFQYFKYKQEVIWYKRQRSSPMDDMGRVYENITVCVKGSRLFNQTRLPYLDIKESIGEFTNISVINRYISNLLSFFHSEKSYQDAINFLNTTNKKDYFTENNSRQNDVSSFKQPKKKISPKFEMLDSMVNGMKPQNLVSFTPHNKLKRDMSGNGGGDHNVKFPTVKPIQLMEYLIDLCSGKDDLILDPFLGSGTTGIACRNLNRQFIGIEIDAGYYDIAYQRIHHEPQASQEEDQDATQEITTIQSPKQRSLF